MGGRFELEFTDFVSKSYQKFTKEALERRNNGDYTVWDLESIRWALRALKKGYEARLAQSAYPERGVDHDRKRAVSSVNHKPKRVERGADHNRKRVRPARFPQRRRDDEDVSSSQIPFLRRGKDV